MRSDTVSFAPGTDGAFGGASAGLVVTALKAFSAADRVSGGWFRAMSLSLVMRGLDLRIHDEFQQASTLQ
jgi:hypothetical protein